ncbi:MAG: hypothetical protein KDB53_18830 [Planctomycetes bacterium]|nr:hypothetical protein [Planctomycetota bacterium]
MGRDKQPDPPPSGAPMWIVTFTDMSSLLLTFFIMLLTFSSMETEKLKQAAGNLSGAFGAMTEFGRRSRPDVMKKDSVMARHTDRLGPTTPSLRTDQIEDEIRRIQDREKYNVKIEVEDMLEGTRIKLTAPDQLEIFRMGSDQLAPFATKLLREIATQFRTLPMRMIIETHVDSEIGNAIPNQTAYEMTLLQGLAAARVLEGAGMIPEDIAVSPQGDARPVGDNATAEGRYRNRRLEILVVPYAKDPVISRKLRES